MLTCPRSGREIQIHYSSLRCRRTFNLRLQKLDPSLRVNGSPYFPLAVQDHPLPWRD